MSYDSRDGVRHDIENSINTILNRDVYDCANVYSKGDAVDFNFYFKEDFHKVLKHIKSNKWLRSKMIWADEKINEIRFDLN